MFETSQTLFWAAFGLIDLDNFELVGIKSFTRFWGLLMFGCYSVINIVVLLNLLIAMMNHSYQLISVSWSWNFLVWKIQSLWLNIMNSILHWGCLNLFRVLEHFLNRNELIQSGNLQGASYGLVILKKVERYAFQAMACFLAYIYLSFIRSLHLLT